MPKNGQVVWTALPDKPGSTGKVKLSILATLIGLRADVLEHYQSFANWPRTLKSLPQLQWEITYAGAPAVRVPFDGGFLSEVMWRSTFAPTLRVEPRKVNKEYQKSDVSTYSARTLNDRHVTFRGGLAALELANVRRSDARFEIGGQLSSEAALLNVFLQPGLGGSSPKALIKLSDPQYKSTILAQVRAREFVEEVKRFDPLLAGRLTRDMARLETEAGIRVKAQALLALVIHHRDQLDPPNAQLAAAITAELAKPIYSAAGLTPKDIEDAKLVLHFLLFHRRPEMPITPRLAQECDTYDFHKVLSMVGQFPVPMRPLGLAFDIEVTAPPMAAAVGAVKTVKVALVSTATMPANSCPFADLDCISLETAYLYDGTLFCARPKDDSLLVGKMLNLNLTSDNHGHPENCFELAIEDIDGSNIKYTQHAQATDRAHELRTQDSPDESETWPATRSLGISLLFDKRGDRTKEAIGPKSKTALLTAAQENSTAPPVLNAEDLVLGYRVDIWDDHSNQWHSLCERRGQYDFIDAPGGSNLRPWVPPGNLRDKEEGFVQWAATIPKDATAENQKQLQVHHSIFCWTGWSLSVPFPGSDHPMNPAVENGKPKPLRIKPTFVVPTFDDRPGSLPALRFGVRYRARCRAVDLAGNSLAPGNPDLEPGLPPKSKPLTYRRWEPVAAPIVLATTKIESDSPGDQLDRLVIRDGNGDTDRILVPPRVTQNFAEAHSKFDKDGLMPGAFEHVELMPDGSFPPFSDSEKASLTDRNPYFRYQRSYNKPPQCGYYPDPLIEMARVMAWRLDCIGTRKFYFNLCLPFFVEGKNVWPDAFPVRLKVVSDNHDIWNLAGVPPDPTMRWELLDEDDNSSRRGPAISIPLRKGETIELTISSVLPKGCERGPSVAKSAVSAMLAIVNSTQLYVNSSGTTLQVRPEDFLDGTLSSVSPTHTLTLVHAVRKPLRKLDFLSNFSIQRTRLDQPGATITLNSQAMGQTRPEIQVDWYSTARLTCQAKWTDRIDDPSKPKPFDLDTKEQAFEIKANELDKNCEMPARNHELRDTRFHQIEYKLTATTRFREYYPDGKTGENDERFQIHSERSYTSLVNNSKRPAVPSVSCVIPAFQWTETKADKTRTHTRSGALRIYLERPWFSSGNGELLGVVFSSTPQPAARLWDFVTQWGVDPLWGLDMVKKNGALATPSPQLGDFSHYKDKASRCFPAEFDRDLDPSRTLEVVGYEVNFDEGRQLWFADIQLGPQKAYFPFIRLALVRFQPNSIKPVGSFDPNKQETFADARISPIVIADFAQLTPNRWASVQRIDADHFKLTVSGVSYYSSQTGQQGPTRFRVAIQKRASDLEKDIGWFTKAEITPEQFTVSSNDGVTTWEALVPIPQSTLFHTYRLLIEEFEQFLGDHRDADPAKDRDPMLAPQPVERLVYADAFELRTIG